MTTTPVLDLLARVLHDAAGLLVELQASRPKPEDLARLVHNIDIRIDHRAQDTRYAVVLDALCALQQTVDFPRFL